jgi:hypothetical protein
MDPPRYVLIGAGTSTTAAGTAALKRTLKLIFLGGRIYRTKVETCSYYETYE